MIAVKSSNDKSSHLFWSSTSLLWSWSYHCYDHHHDDYHDHIIVMITTMMIIMIIWLSPLHVTCLSNANKWCRLNDQCPSTSFAECFIIILLLISYLSSSSLLLSLFFIIITTTVSLIINQTKEKGPHLLSRIRFNNKTGLQINFIAAGIISTSSIAKYT